MVTTICLLWILCCSAAEAEVLSPGDLTMITLNTNYTLSWDWDQSAEESNNVTFTTQFIAKFRLKHKKPLKWTTACEEIMDHFCDLTAFNLYYQGLYSVCVQASMNGNHSDWACKDFCPDKEAAIGPPAKVVLNAAGSHLDVFITDPITSTNSSMKENLPELYYQILYWERNVEREDEFNLQDRTTRMLSSSANMVTLPNLRAWTWYCVKIRSRHNFYNKSSSFTSPNCMQTEGPIPWWQIFVSFLGSLLICFLCAQLSIMGWFWCDRTCREVFFPQLPPHFKKCLLDSTVCDRSDLILSDSELELLCDHVTICPKPAIQEIPNPPAEDSLTPSPSLKPDTRHTCQARSNSGDSGIYSSSGMSAVLQSNVHQTVTDLGDSCGSPQQIKIDEVVVGLKLPPDIMDEKVVGM